MLKFKTVYRSINIVNIVLACSIILLFLFNILPTLHADIEISVPPQSDKLSADTADRQIEEDAQKIPSPDDYIVVAYRNLFHPERKIPEPELEDSVEEEKPEFVLFGTMQIGGAEIAYIQDKKAPLSTPGRGARQTVLKKGESLSGYVLSEVYQDRVLMVKGDDTMEVHIVDPSNPKERNVEATEVKPQEAPKGQERNKLRRVIRPREENKKAFDPRSRG